MQDLLEKLISSPEAYYDLKYRITISQCLKMKKFTQIMHQPGFEPTTYSRR